MRHLAAILLALGKLVENRFFVGEFPGFQLGVDQLAIHGQFEAAALAGNQSETLHALLQCT